MAGASATVHGDRGARCLARVGDSESNRQRTAHPMNFTVNASGNRVTDAVTGLIWQRNARCVRNPGNSSTYAPPECSEVANGSEPPSSVVERACRPYTVSMQTDSTSPGAVSMSHAPRRTIPKRVAVVGAGLAGLSCARTLRDHSIDVTVFDKGRAPGGRLANRCVANLSFDLGAQYLTARDPRFLRWVESWQQDGVCAHWPGRIVAVDDSSGLLRETAVIPRWVGTPNMAALARHLARDVSVLSSHRVDALARLATGFTLTGTVREPGTALSHLSASTQSATSLGQFDIVLVCLPAPQSSALLATVSPALSTIAANVAFDPCFAAGVVEGGSSAALASLAFDGAFIGRDNGTSPLAWVARETSKPGRGGLERWMLHASTHFSKASLEAQPEAVATALAREFARLFRVPTPEVVTAHRWRYARAPEPCTRDACFDEAAGLGLAGDWLAGGRVEGAVLSGVALAGSVLGSFQ